MSIVATCRQNGTGNRRSASAYARTDSERAPRVPPARMSCVAAAKKVARSFRSNFSMPKKYRLSRADFIRLPRASRRVHGSYFSLTSTLFPALGEPRAACVVSKKIAARAVDRNRIERRCREVLRPLMKNIKQPFALIFHAKREAVGATFVEIQRDILKLLERVIF